MNFRHSPSEILQKVTNNNPHHLLMLFYGFSREFLDIHEKSGLYIPVHERFIYFRFIPYSLMFSLQIYLAI